MIYCSKCLYHSKHPLGLTFNHNSVCSGCVIHEEKIKLNWGEKEKELKSLFDDYRNSSGKNWDCIIPISGSRDSYFIVDKVKNQYKMNPLLVTYNKHFNTHTGNRNIAHLKRIFDCDSITLTVDPSIVKELTRYLFNQIGSVYWHCISGDLVFSVRIAVNFKIPLIIWGAHQGIEQVGMFSHNDMAEMNTRYRLEHDFMGIEIKDLIGKSKILTKENLYPFIYPNDQEISSAGIRGIFLSNYMPWDTKKQHEEMIKRYDYKTLNENRTIDYYNNSDSMIYTHIHDFIKYIKYGYTIATDHLVREIRWGRISKKDASDLQKFYFSQRPKHLNNFLDWLGIKEDDFFKILDKFINKDIFGSNIDSKSLFYGLEIPNSKQNKLNQIKFKKNHFQKENNDYSLLEKGYSQIE